MYDFIYSSNRNINIVFTLNVSLRMYTLLTPGDENILENAKHVQLEIGTIRKLQTKSSHVAIS